MTIAFWRRGVQVTREHVVRNESLPNESLPNSPPLTRLASSVCCGPMLDTNKACILELKGSPGLHQVCAAGPGPGCCEPVWPAP